MNDAIGGDWRHHVLIRNLRNFAYRIIDTWWPVIFGAGISLSAFWAASADAQMHGLGSAQALLIVWLIGAALFNVTRFIFSQVKERDSHVGAMYYGAHLPVRGLQYAVAGLLAIGFVFLVALSGLSLWLLWLSPVLFTPGMIILVKRYPLSGSKRRGLFPRPVTRHAVVYATAAAASVLSAALLSVWLAKIPSSQQGMPALISFGVAPAVCTFLTLLVVYAVMHEKDLSRLQTELLTLGFERIIQQDNYANVWEEVARLIQAYLRLERIVIITPDVHYHCAMRAATPAHRERRLQAAQFYIKGLGGRGRNKLERLSYPAQGIALNVLREMKTRVIPDVNRDPNYFANGLTDTRSELYVPVPDLFRQDEAIAIIVAQETRRSAFSKEDRENIERLAGYLASFSRHLEHSSSYQRLHAEIQRLSESKHANFNDVMKTVRNTFQTESVAYIPLAFATYRPILEGAQALHEGFVTPFAPDPVWLEASGDIPGLIRSWTPLLNPKIEPAQAVNCSLCDWASRESFQALAIVPVGGSGAGGLFIIGFRESIKGEEAHLETLLHAFANRIAPFVDGEWRHWWKYETTFVAPTIEMHQIMNRHSLGRNHLEASLSKVISGDQTISHTLAADIKAVFAEFHDLEAMSHPLGQDELLANAVARFKESLRGRYTFEVLHHVDPRLEKESLELRTMLYRIVCEALLNSLCHGKARNILLFALRRPNTIDLLVYDNGAGFDVAELQHLGERKHGMLALCRRLSDLTGALPIDWMWTAPRRGTCLKIVVPCLPLETASQADVDIPVEWERRFNRLETLYERPTPNATSAAV